MTKMPAVQKGMGASGLLFVVLVVIFVMTLVFKLGPGYMGFMTVRSIMNEVAAAPEPFLGGKAAVLNAVETRMNINDVRNLDLKSFTVASAGEGTYDLGVNYEQRTHLFFNIDAVLTFHHAVVVKGR